MKKYKMLLLAALVSSSLTLQAAKNLAVLQLYRSVEFQDVNFANKAVREASNIESVTQLGLYLLAKDMIASLAPRKAGVEPGVFKKVPLEPAIEPLKRVSNRHLESYKSEHLEISSKLYKLLKSNVRKELRQNVRRLFEARGTRDAADVMKNLRLLRDRILNNLDDVAFYDRVTEETAAKMTDLGLYIPSRKVGIIFLRRTPPEDFKIKFKEFEDQAKINAVYLLYDLAISDFSFLDELDKEITAMLG